MIIITLILAAIIVNTIATRIIIVDLLEEFLADYVNPKAIRICLIPPIGIAISAIAMVSVLAAMLIMMILEIWDR